MLAGFDAKPLLTSFHRQVALSKSFVLTGIAGAVRRTLLSKSADVKTPYDFGAVGDGAADDTAALQAFVNYVLTTNVNGDWGDGTYKITGTITVQPTIAGRWFCFRGRGARSIVTCAVDGIPLFNFNITGIGSVNYCAWTNLTTIGVSGTTNNAAVHYRITGDATLFQHMDWSGCVAINGYSVWKDEKLPRTTGFGLEASMNWNMYKGVRAINVTQYVFWGLNGTGTGNVWSDLRAVTTVAGSAVFRFEGVGCVVGDVIFAGVQAGCSDAVTGSALLSIGASTVYRAQWALTGCQWDANCNRVVEMDGTGAIEYSNWTISGNNHGGGSDLGTNLQPLSRSIVEDRNVSRWETGVYYTTNATGAQALDVFEVTMAAFGSAVIELVANSLVAGVQTCTSRYLFEVRADASALTGTLLEGHEGLSGQLVWSFSTTGTLQGKFTLAFTPSSAGSRVEAVMLSRFAKFKARRMVSN